MTKHAVIVSDHALVRYLERVKGVDVESYRQEIVALVDAAARCGASTVSANGFTFHLDGWKVTTIAIGSTPHSARMQSRKHNGHSIRLRGEARR